MDNNKPNKLIDIVLPILNYVGFIGAVITSIAYIFVVIVLIKGFEVTVLPQIFLFAIINAVIGFIIMQFLKVQGISIAKQQPENIKVVEEYTRTHPPKDRKYHSLTYYWVLSVLKDIAFKGLTLAATTFGIVYIVIQASNDWGLLLLAIVNLLLFISFGLLSMNSAYEYYNNEHIPFLQHKIKVAGEPVIDASALNMEEKTNNDNCERNSTPQSGGTSS